MLANIISQTMIDEVIGNSEDSLPNKIKEKEESLQNTLKNRLTIPMMAQSTKNVTNETNYTEYKDEEPIVKTQNDAHIEVVNNNNGFELNDFTDTQVFEGSEKPINVKEHMIQNISKKFAKLLESKHEEIKEDFQEAEPIVAEPIQKELIEEPKIVEESVNQVTEASHYGMPANIEQILVNTVDFDTTVVAINQTREKYKNVAEQANMAAQAAEESAKLLAKVSNEYTEAERSLKEKELKSKEMEQRILALLNSEQNRLSQQMQEKENVIDNANKIKEENNGKIVDFKTKINSTLEKANEYDEMISKQEQLLNRLVEFNMNFESTETVEKTPNRVA